MPETSYAKCGDLSLAYQVFGAGPVELVFVPPFTSHVELFWTLPGFKANLDQLATFCRVLLFDKAGVGLSDPVPHVPTLDDRAAEIEAVMDAVGFRKAAIFGVSEGGPAAVGRVDTPARNVGAHERCPGMARATLEAVFRVDVRPILPTITAPTLVIHAREDPIPVQGGRYLADHISGARLLEDRR